MPATKREPCSVAEAWKRAAPSSVSGSKPFPAVLPGGYSKSLIFTPAISSATDSSPWPFQQPMQPTSLESWTKKHPGDATEAVSQ